MLLSKSFSSSKLVRLLADTVGLETEHSRQDVAERLSTWMNHFDAIALHATHQAMASMNCTTPSALPVTGPEDLEAALEKVRTSVLKSLVSTITPRLGRQAHAKIPPRSAVTSRVVDEQVADYSVYRQRYRDAQRQMTLKVGPLRVHAREVLSRMSPSLRQLAVLDAAMEQMMQARVDQWLATVPQLLERRFEHLKQLARQDEAITPASAQNWITVFQHEIQEILKAELALRLEPIEGLVQAWRHEIHHLQ